jgi:LacI family transcriptional regulator
VGSFAVKLTLEDIGRMAGVSRSTVSRVINEQNSVSPEARRRVREVIERTGFLPNVAARSLASNRTGIIGLVIPSRVHNLFGDPYFGTLIQGMSRAGNEAGTTLSLFIFQTEEEEEKLYPRVVRSGLVDGIVLTASRMGDPLQTRLIDGAIPFVMVGKPDRKDEVSYVDADNVGGAREAAIHLCSLGYRRIAYLGAPMSTTAGVDRLEGFRQGLATCGAVLHPELRADGDFSERSGYSAIRKIMPHRPDAVFIASDTMAVGALRALKQDGVNVPIDLAIVSFDGLPSSEVSSPPLSTVRQPISQTGARAVELLLALVAGKVVGPVADVLPTELVIRESSGAARPHHEDEKVSASH